MAARHGAPAVPGGGLGRARRRAGRRPRQLGPALPHHLGHRPGAGRAVRASRPGRRGAGPGRAPLPAPRRRPRVVGWRRDRRTRCRARAQRRRPWAAELTGRGRGLRDLRAGGRGDLRRHRRRPRPGPQGLAGSARAAPGADGGRRPGARGRPDAADHRGRRGPDHQPGPDVALRRGPPELGPDLGEPRHPGAARAVVAVGRRDRAAAARAVLPGLRHARHAPAPARHRPRLLVVRAHPEDHREGVRALRLRAEPGPDRQEHPAAAQPGRAPVRPDRSRRSSSTAPTSWWPTRCPSWSRA